MMRKAVATPVAAIVLCAGAPLRADEHLVPREAIHGRWLEVEGARRADLAFLGARVGPLKPFLHRLHDDDLRELKARAVALEADPQASGPGGVMIAVLVVVAVVLLAGMVLELD
jgi:hypothetical protein